MTFDPELPKPESSDKVITVFRSLIAGVPWVGGSINEVWSGFFSSPLAKRREAWLYNLALAVVELQNTAPNLSIDALQDDERFLTAVLTATAIAIRTHRKEKLDALRHAAISSVLNTDIDEDEQAMFMKYVDDFTPYHLRVLTAFHDPDAHFAKLGTSVGWFVVDASGTRWSPSKNTYDFVVQAFPEVTQEHQFMDQVVEDLGTRNLIAVKWMFQEKLPDIGPYTKRTGEKFMRFIGQSQPSARLKSNVTVCACPLS